MEGPRRCREGGVELIPILTLVYWRERVEGPWEGRRVENNWGRNTCAENPLQIIKTCRNLRGMSLRKLSAFILTAPGRFRRNQDSVLFCEKNTGLSVMKKFYSF